MAIVDLFGSPEATNDQLVAAQREEALNAARRAEDLKRRRAAAEAHINAIFDGGTYNPSMAAGFDWGRIDANRQAWDAARNPSPAAPPAGTGDVVQLPNGNWVRRELSEGGAVRFVPADPPSAAAGASGPSWYDGLKGTKLGDFFLNSMSAFTPGQTGRASFGPNGVLFDPETFKPTTGKISDTQKTYKGIGDDFYDAYAQSIRDYYTPQLEDNFADATGETVLGFSARGTRGSSAEAEAFKDLETQRRLQFANMAQRADADAGALKDSITREKQGLLALARSAEDPTSAIDRALTEVNAVQTQKPNLSPLGDIFGAAAIGYGSFEDQRNRNAYLGQIPTSNSYTSGPKSSGKKIGG